jgi:hypothetical protein
MIIDFQGGNRGVMTLAKSGSAPPPPISSRNARCGGRNMNEPPSQFDKQTDRDNSIVELFLETRSFAQILLNFEVLNEIKSKAGRQKRLLRLLAVYLKDFVRAYDSADIVNEKSTIMASARRTIELFISQLNSLFSKDVGDFLAKYFSARKYEKIISWLDSELSEFPSVPNLDNTVSNTEPTNADVRVRFVFDTANRLLQLSIDGKPMSPIGRFADGAKLLLALWNAPDHKLSKSDFDKIHPDTRSKGKQQLREIVGPAVFKSVFQDDIHGGHMWLTDAVFVDVQSTAKR